MHDESRRPGPQSGPSVAVKKRRTARIVCAGDSTFWTTPRQFWDWVREGLVAHQGDNPLTGRFEGRREKLIVKVRSVLLDNGAPEHKDAVLKSYVYRVK